jgi:hypothetical protein
VFTIIQKGFGMQRNPGRFMEGIQKVDVVQVFNILQPCRELRVDFHLPYCACERDAWMGISAFSVNGE